MLSLAAARSSGRLIEQNARNPGVCVVEACALEVSAQQFRNNARSFLGEEVTGYTRTRQRLAALWLTLEWNIGCLEPVVPLDDLTRMQTHVAWELERYGGLQAPTTYACPKSHRPTA